MSNNETYDYIIVGSGSAGSVLAYRLSENPNLQILLIEAGPPDKSPFIHMPKGLGKVHTDPAYLHTHTTEPEASTDGKPDNWIRGKVTGGSSSINGMVYVRGQPKDYDELAANTSDDWSWKYIGEAYKAIEAHELGAAETRGDRGNLHISLPQKGNPLNEAMIAAAKSLGLPEKEDVNTPDNSIGVGYVPQTIYQGRRQSTSVAFIDPIKKFRKNLTLRNGLFVDHVVIEDSKAVGVLVHEGERLVQINARKEVILSAGALHSPAMLMRSGIGDAQLLQKLDIPVKANIPAVGKHLREHRCMMFQFKVKGEGSENKEYGGWRVLKNVFQYFLKRTGPMAKGVYCVGAWVKTEDGLDRPDAQILFAPISVNYDNPKGIAMDSFDGMHVCTFILRPESEGDLEIRSKDVHAPLRLRPNYHAAEADRKKLISVTRYARNLFEQPSLKQYVAEETRPGSQFQSDEEIIEAFDQLGCSGQHAIGTCRMGKEDASVTDCVLTPDLKVRGVENLRVVDASVFPTIPAGNTNGPIMAMAWRAADVILRDA